jgi:hypothetical protein
MCSARCNSAREQVVDLEAVRLTRKRRSYLDALVAVAARSLQPDVAPAPLFLKKRQLAVRVAAVLKETSMSIPRIVASVTAVSTAAVAAVAVAIWIFPMQAQTQSETRSSVLTGALDSAGIVVEAGGTLMHRKRHHLSARRECHGHGGDRRDAQSEGRVVDARVLSGPNELRRSALESVLGWHYATDTSAPPIGADQHPFQPGAAGSEVASCIDDSELALDPRSAPSRHPILRHDARP